MSCDKPSTTAVLPTPGSPIGTGLFLVRRDRTCITRSMLFSRPIAWDVELAVARELREVAPELVSHRALAAALLGAGDLLALAGGVAGQELDRGLADAVEVGAELLQHLRGDALADQPERRNVLGADVVVTELERFAQRPARGPSWRAG